MSRSWDKRVKEIEKRYRDEGFDDFLSWSVIQATMYVGDVAPYMKNLRKETAGMIDEYLDSNLIVQLFHTKQWLDQGNDVNDVETVVEIGGGYGAMHHVWRILGFNGSWSTIDYRIMTELQKYYSNLMGIPEPHKIESSPNCDMLIACFSLSEMDLEEREVVMNNAKFNKHLVAFASAWDGIDNRKYFSGWPGVEIEHPHIKSVYYHVQ